MSRLPGEDLEEENFVLIIAHCNQDNYIVLKKLLVGKHYVGGIVFHKHKSLVSIFV